MIESPARHERRDTAARAARDELAEIIRVHPRRLAALDRDLAQLLTQRIETARRNADEAGRDALTSLPHRTIGQRTLEREVERAHRGSRSLSLIFADVNGLKRINDGRGHAAGDRVLAALGTAFRQVLRPYDTAMRWGGDEFVVVLPEVDLERARFIAERIGECFYELTGETVTCGCAELRTDEDGPDLVARADAEMYLRK